LPDDIIQNVINKLNEGKSYRQIHSEVTYKAKYGKINKLYHRIQPSVKLTYPFHCCYNNF